MQFKNIVIIVGNYGSGKTEVSISLAVKCKGEGVEVRVADLDLVNPYFRTREARGQLSELGIEVVLPPDQYLHADLPILSPLVAGMIRNPGQLSILDVGGDDAGATVLATLSESFRGKDFQMLQVVNPFRPFTQTLEGCAKIRDEIERASTLMVTGIIGNANLIDHTAVEDIYSGYEFVNRFADESGLPLELITIPSGLESKIDIKRFSCPVLKIQRQLVPPWINAARLAMGNTG